MSKILVTGGAGFIGSHIVDALIQDGHKVAVVDNLITGRREFVNKKAKFYRIDIRSAKSLGILFQRSKFDVVIHHAAQMDVRKSVADPIFDADNNIIGALNLLENCVRYKVKKFIFASTGGAIYGDASVIPTPETYPAWPISPYGVAKLTVEHYLYFYKVNYGLKYVALRYGNVYGPRQNPHGEAGVVAIFSKKLLAGEQPIINGHGRQTRDYVYVSDVVRANLLALKKNVVGSFNIGTGEETDVNQIFRGLVKIAGFEVKEKHGPAKPGEQKRSSLNCSLVRRELGWRPKVKLEDGLRETIEYFKTTSPLL